MPPAIGCERGLATLRGERQQLVAIRARLGARRLPFDQHRVDFGDTHPPRVLAHRARGVELAELRRVLAVLPRAGRPRQIDREHERHHVRVRRSADRVASPRRSSRASSPRPRARPRSPRSPPAPARARTSGCASRSASCARRPAAARCRGRSPADARPRRRCSARARSARAATAPAASVARLRSSITHALRGDQLALRRLAGAIGRREGRHRELGFADLRGDHALGLRGVAAREPRRRRVALDGERRRFDGDGTPLRIALRALASGAGASRRAEIPASRRPSTSS